MTAARRGPTSAPVATPTASGARVRRPPARLRRRLRRWRCSPPTAAPPGSTPPMPATGQVPLRHRLRDASHLWAVGGSGLAWESTDGGASWAARDLGTGTSARGRRLRRRPPRLDLRLRRSSLRPPTAAPPGTRRPRRSRPTSTTAPSSAPRPAGSAPDRVRSPARPTAAPTGRCSIQRRQQSSRASSSSTGCTAGRVERRRRRRHPDGGNTGSPAVRARPTASRTSRSWTRTAAGWSAAWASIMSTATAGYGDFARPATRAYAASVRRGRTVTLCPQGRRRQAELRLRHGDRQDQDEGRQDRQDVAGRA